MEDDIKFYKRLHHQKLEENSKLARSNAALKGVITKLKNQEVKNG